METTNLPARAPFPVLSLVFQQTVPPTGASAARDLYDRLRAKARNTALYRLSVCIDPPDYGRQRDGTPIAIDTLGKWLFGTPGYRRNLDVLPDPETIEMQLYTDLPAAHTLVVQTAERMGLRLLKTRKL